MKQDNVVKHEDGLIDLEMPDVLELVTYPLNREQRQVLAKMRARFWVDPETGDSIPIPALGRET